jgi:hypothetical protein
MEVPKEVRGTDSPCKLPAISVSLFCSENLSSISLQGIGLITIIIVINLINHPDSPERKYGQNTALGVGLWWH